MYHLFILFSTVAGIRIHPGASFQFFVFLRFCVKVMIWSSTSRDSYFLLCLKLLPVERAMLLRSWQGWSWNRQYP